MKGYKENEELEFDNILNSLYDKYNEDQLIEFIKENELSEYKSIIVMKDIINDKINSYYE